jgi:lipopolysaccharide transport system ATP-binding protein
MQVITAHNIGKKYVIDSQKMIRQSVSIKETVVEGLNTMLGRGDRNNIEKEDFWALREVNFAVEQGDRVGIVGHNGAGKSTLLKILSRITEPTVGQVKITGRVASLLEVGTGFHPELTGRENVFLNGAVLGMKRHEIQRQFDEIVAFSGVEQFLDTPVKRYSSGMYVRLGFAIAAHLNPEILIIDEVLAVGDADFQKKCLGKMRDVSASGRTILFVSHNLTAVQALCNKAFYFEHGQLLMQGETASVVTNYLSHNSATSLERTWTADDALRDDEDTVRFKRVAIEPAYLDGQKHIDVRTAFKIRTDFWNNEAGAILNVSLHVYSLTGECVFNLGTKARAFDKGVVSAALEVPGYFLNDGSYIVSIMLVKDTSTVLYYLTEALTFEIEDYREGTTWYGKWPGYVRPQFNYTIELAELAL